MHFNGQKSSRVSEQFSYTSQFVVKMQKNVTLFEEKRFACVVFIEFKYKLLQTGLADLNKSQTLETLLSIFFFNYFFKISHFCRFLNIISRTQLIV